MRPHAGWLAVASIAMAIVAATTAATAWLMDPVVNKVFVEQDRSTLWLVGGAVIVTFVLKSAAAYFQDSLLARVGQRIVADVQLRLFGHLLDQDVALFQSRATGGLISHFTYDVQALRQAVSNAIVGLVRDGLSVIFLVGVMVYQDWLLSLIALLVAPLTVVPIQKLGKRMRRVSGDAQARMGELTTLLGQAFQGIRVIKAYAMERAETKRIGAIVEEIYALTYRQGRVRAAVQPIVDVFGGIAVAAVIVYGGYRVIEGATTPGAFFSFIAAVLMAYQPLRGLGKVSTTLQEGLAAAERLFVLLDRKSEIAEAPDAKALPREPAEVALHDVRFRYADGTEALAGIDLVAPAGKVTALVGPSGAGKSTVLNLIPRFFDVESGSVTIAGTDVRGLTLASLRDAVALVSQEIVLFDDTVAENIRFGRPDANDEELRAAAEAAAAHDFISALPDGYATRVGEHGTKLSGGQRQRIAIARAILKDAPILLLDEATSALDTESERQIQAALARLMKGRTTLVIAHRLSTVQGADLIHAFEAGRVVESGDHHALVERGGTYARLHALQFREPQSAA
ncbi:ABC transporter transmembrane domain-containing protein [Thalassobaculum sp. OXR-137]|uniref:ABC transporter ATP-binding protein n=1 Tax=Thalassobaculum sp. OXR-137 TaxID=3100173 RepID=UPI002AC8AEA2|nr:ABC transporter transmembrane domain-containing protein [Thalassobaculum sp. OXR-137]WPZ32510.1 ABC transporter transmembrane domain-containing protein [Thalassobaculum sp. OXR-137]